MVANSFHFPSYLQQRAALINTRLEQLCPPGSRLQQAMAYCLLAPGKRLRPVLTLAAGELVGGQLEQLMPGALAIEMVHAMSLVHDDLPAMDNDTLRRGRPTCHIAFDEATALLAGDALLAAAFGTLARAPGVQVGQAVQELSQAALAMCQGQSLDLLAEGREITAGELERIHSLKTGALLVAAARIGCLLGSGSALDLERLSTYAQAVGLAFQIIDDVLDATASTTELGKTAGKDQKAHKATFVTVHGVAAARRWAQAALAQAQAALAGYGPSAEPLRALGEYTVSRRR
ncbi:MAG: polyprenyl synthetase family protein [Deinococcus sp.]|nr:polyprenyl synthetase family protein [Deinococcus sp.]